MPYSTHQEHEDVAQSKVVVDAAEQHHQHRAGEQQPGPGRQDIDAALA